MSKKKEEPIVEVVEEVVEAIAAPAAVVYVGRSILQGRLTQYTTYKNGIPPHLANLLEQYPFIRHLFVPADKLAKARKDLNTKGTALNEFNSKLKEVK